MKSFSMQNDRRLDSLWMDLIPNQKEYSELRSFLKTVLILSHGNSFAERGFSINKEMLIESLSTESIITLKQVYHAIEYHKRIEVIEIDKSMIHAARNAHAYYLKALKKEKEEADEERKLKAAKRKSSEKVKELEEKKKIIMMSERSE